MSARSLTWTALAALALAACVDVEAGATCDADESCRASERCVDGSCQPGCRAGAERSWWVDSDADGLGAVGDALLACEAPASHVETSGDCDDADPSVGRFFLDGDGDGEGDPRRPAPTCDLGVGNDDDCDDADGTAHSWPSDGVEPALPCRAGRALASCTPAQPCASSAADVRIEGRTVAERLGNPVLADIDGDGALDLVASAPTWRPAGVAELLRGRIYVAFGPVPRSARSSVERQPVVVVDGSLSFGALGDSLRAAGDLDGDSGSELLVGTLGKTSDTERSEGGTALLLGSGALTAHRGAGRVDVTAVTLRRYVVNLEAPTAGQVVALGVFDLDGDGVPDPLLLDLHAGGSSLVWIPGACEGLPGADGIPEIDATGVPSCAAVSGAELVGGRIGPAPAELLFGRHVAVADLRGSGVELVVSAEGEGDGVGAVRVFSAFAGALQLDAARLVLRGSPTAGAGALAVLRGPGAPTLLVGVQGVGRAAVVAVDAQADGELALDAVATEVVALPAAASATWLDVLELRPGALHLVVSSGAYPTDDGTARGEVRVFAARGGALVPVSTVVGTDARFNFAVQRPAAGDISGDGEPDLLVSSPEDGCFDCGGSLQTIHNEGAVLGFLGPPGE